MCKDKVIGKTINLHGRIYTVTHISEDGIIAYLGPMHNTHPMGDWSGMMVLRKVAEALPVVVSRNSFDYRPGDRG